MSRVLPRNAGQSLQKDAHASTRTSGTQPEGRVPCLRSTFVGRTSNSLKPSFRKLDQTAKGRSSASCSKRSAPSFNACQCCRRRFPQRGNSLFGGKCAIVQAKG